MPDFKLFIDGQWRASSTGESFEDINPATLGLVGKFSKASPEDVQSAIDSAEDAFDSWSSTPAPSRAKILFKVARMLEDGKEDLARMMTMEMGKVLKESRGEVQEAIDMAYYAAGEGRRLLGETTPSELPDKLCMTVRLPLGVMGMITPFNFPLSIPSWKIMPALVSGNTIVFKPASDTPLLAVELVKILVESGLPKGVINLVMGEGGSVGSSIIRNKKVRAISFTGSLDTGKWIMGEAAREMKRVSLELGGKNPIIVMEDADMRLALDGIIWGAFGTTGQRCTAASRVIVQENVLHEFQRLLVERTAQLRIGNGLDESIDVGPLINSAQLQKVARYVEVGKEEGARLVQGGSMIKPLPGYFFQPTIFADVTPDMKLAQEEIFGPVLSLMSASDLDDAIEIANSAEYGLSSAIYTSNMNKAFKAIEKIEAGITYINSSTIGAEIQLPFGGVKSTGNGTREAGTVAIEEFTSLKTVYIDYSGKLQRAQIDIE